MKCIDVSKHNGNINWTLVKQQGVENVIIKAINKQNAIEENFNANYNGAFNAGFNIGVYNYSYATTKAEATNAANTMLKQISGKQIPLGVWLDIEDDIQKNLGHTLIEIINTYAYIITKAGYKFGVYTGLSFYNTYLKTWASELNYPFWVARYPYSGEVQLSYNPDATKKPSIGKDIWGWQYTSNGRVPGIAGAVDVSEIYSATTIAPTVTNGTVYIGHASGDENGGARGGAAGDQTGKEVCVRTWYNKPWIAVFRPKDKLIAGRLASVMEQACANDKIGYNQNERTTLFTQAQAAGWDLSKVGFCNTDCSALVAVCCNAAGVRVSQNMYTGNEVDCLNATGQFTMLTDPIYLTSSMYLQRGDILLGKGHTAIVLGDGIALPENKPNIIVTPSTPKLEEPTAANPAVAGWYITTGNLTLRYGAGKDKEKITVMPKGSRVQFFGRYTPVDGIAWCYVVYGNLVGFCSIEYLKKI